MGDSLSMVQCLLLFLLLSIGITFSQDDNVCVFGSDVFLPGENLGDAMVTRCGTAEEWPCFCNPALETMAECPYCPFSAADGSLHCARNNETIVFEDGSISRNCSCVIPEDPTQSPIRECSVVAPSVGCNWFDEDFNPVIFENGTSFGELGEGVCGSTTEWPSLCYVPPGSQGGDDFLINYPYCVFTDTQSGDEVCAHDGSNVTYINNEGIEVYCTCIYTINVGQVVSCKSTSPTSPPAPSVPTNPTAVSGAPVTAGPAQAPVNTPVQSPVPETAVPTQRSSATKWDRQVMTTVCIAIALVF